MVEKETKPGVFISVVTKENWLKRTDALSGEDLTHFIQKCNPFKLVTDSLEGVLGVNMAGLLKVCRDLEPEFDPISDYYTVRYAPNKEGA